MSLNLKKVVTSTPDGTIRRTRSEVPEYIQKAISDSLERGKHDARANVFVADRQEPPARTSHE